MRVVAGSAGGRRLRAPAGRQVRPTSERVREALFNALGSLDVVGGAAVVDLFAGTGALGIEALSRGAASVTFVDADLHAVRAVEENLAATGLGGRAKVVHADVFRFLEELSPGQAGPGQAGPGEPGPGEPGRRPVPFDIAFADPPYAFTDWPRLLDLLPARLAALEARSHIELGSGWRPLRSRRYGDTVVTLARRAIGAQAGHEEEG